MNEAVSRFPALYDGATLVEGYADLGTPGQGMLQSRRRAMLVRAYLEVQYQVAPKNTGIIGLSATPPAAAGKSTWDGVCLVHLGKP